MATDSDLLDDAKEEFKRASEAESENRSAALDDLKFGILEEQWPAKIKNQREKDGRPCLTRNLLGPFIRQVVNDGRQNRPAIKVQPADDGADVFTSHVITGLIRNIENVSRADIAYDTALEFAVAGGFGYIGVGTEYACDDAFDKDIQVQAIEDPFTIYGDPDGTSVDGSDWNSVFQVEKVRPKTYEQLYKGKDKVDWDVFTSGLDSDWAEGTDSERMITVANWWRREKIMRTIVMLDSGDVLPADEYKAMKAVFDSLGASVVGERDVPSYAVNVTKLSGAEVIEKSKPWAGRWIPFVPVYGHRININGQLRIASLIRSAKDAQRSYNFHHTTAAELTGYAPKAPFIGPKGAFKTDRAKWETANSESWPFIEYDLVPGMGAPPQRQAFAGVPVGEVTAAQQAASDMKAIIGMFESSLGQRSNETSGKAIIARQREGDTATFHYIDNLTRAIRQVGEIVLDLIPSVYLPDRVIRVLGPDMSSQTITLGQPQPRQDAEGNMQKDPQTGQVLLHVYDLAKGKYRLVVSAGPGYTTKREEAAGQMIELIRAYPMAASVIGDLLAKNLDWPGADEIAARLKAMMPQQALGGDSPETVQLKQNLSQAQNELQQLQATIQQMQTDRQLKSKEVDLKAREVDIDAYEAETRRMQAFVGKNGVGLSAQDVQSTVLQTIQQLLNDPDLLGPTAANPLQIPQVPHQLPSVAAGDQDGDEPPQPGGPPPGPPGGPPAGPPGGPPGPPPGPPPGGPPPIPARASGGPVQAGQPYLVGEKGPEVIVPQQDATVIPNGGGWDANLPQPIAPGNLDPWNRPIYEHPDGKGYGTTLSISVNTPHGETVIPTIIGGHPFSQADAIQHFLNTGENFGSFRTPEEADAYAQALHEEQARRIDAAGGWRAVKARNGRLSP
jgi:hypothetical protein